MASTTNNADSRPVASESLANGAANAQFHKIIADQLQALRDRGIEPSPQDLALAIRAHAIAEVNRRKASQEDLVQEGAIVNDRFFGTFIKPTADDDELTAHKRPRLQNLPRRDSTISPLDGTNILYAICQYGELAVELGKQLWPRDIINLMLACRPFHDAVRSNFMSSIKAWARGRAPLAMRIFPIDSYPRYRIPDPSRHDHCTLLWRGPNAAPLDTTGTVRLVPSLQWLEMICVRDQKVREIMAVMARSGHRLPRNMYATLLKIWLISDIATTRIRKWVMRTRGFFTNQDVYNTQLFLIKLDMHFNDPIYGPGESYLTQLMMGQRGLVPLWELLFRKRYTTLNEIVRLQVKYRYLWSPDQLRRDGGSGITVLGVPYPLVGSEHKEGWGKGIRHLKRIDELIAREATRRRLDLGKHIRYMQLWGFFDWRTGQNLVPSEEEMYVSDQEEKLSRVDQSHHWKLRHALKKRWGTLSQKQREAIIEEEEQELLRAEAWTDPEDRDVVYFDSEAYVNGIVPELKDSRQVVATVTMDGDEQDGYDIEEEMHRGWTVPPIKKYRLDDMEFAKSLSRDEVINEVVRERHEFHKRIRYARLTKYEMPERDRLEAKANQPFTLEEWPELIHDHTYAFIPKDGSQDRGPQQPTVHPLSSSQDAGDGDDGGDEGGESEEIGDSDDEDEVIGGPNAESDFDEEADMLASDAMALRDAIGYSSDETNPYDNEDGDLSDADGEDAARSEDEGRSGDGGGGDDEGGGDEEGDGDEGKEGENGEGAGNGEESDKVMGEYEEEDDGEGEDYDEEGENGDSDGDTVLRSPATFRSPSATLFQPLPLNYLLSPYDTPRHDFDDGDPDNDDSEAW